MNPNRINGQPLEFGNREQIEFVNRHNRIFSGEEAFHEIEWKFCIYMGHTGPTSKPRFKIVEWNNACDAVVDYIPCPRCRRIHILLVHGGYNPYDLLVAANRKTDDGFHCWNCKTEFYTENHFVFVKKNQE